MSLHTDIHVHIRTMVGKAQRVTPVGLADSSNRTWNGFRRQSLGILTHSLKISTYSVRVQSTKFKSKVSKWEEHLVARAQLGERAAMELLVESYRPSIRAHALRMLRDIEDANDATQDTFVKAFRALKTFDPSRPFLPWLMRICSNCCVDMIRDRKRDPEAIEKHEHALFDQTADVETGVETRQESEVVQDAITRLPDRYREIIVMRHYRHMDVNEIAFALNKPEGTVKSWLFRARALLKKDLTMLIGA